MRIAAISVSVSLSLFAALPVAAQTCPPVPDHAQDLAALFTAANAAETEREGRAVTAEMWAVLADAPDDRAQAMLDRGMKARGAFDLDAADAAFDELVAYCPDYAEGYNQRAFVAYLRQDFGAALDDLERALDRTPTHVPAMAGLALTLTGMGRTAAAQGVLRRALTLNPWLPERSLLVAEFDTSL